ncbi:ATP-binding protein [Pantoea stewartii]|uniref:ATP-binding protein n=1 Tax=Pantoea stewartii TaxID=66269 RepID=UPI000906E82D|nr:ATP-binding protein [Pantoea stewartii]
MLGEFRKFHSLQLSIQRGKNLLIGDNESGKSSVLLALDLNLSGSRHRVESLGVESQISRQAELAFQRRCTSRRLTAQTIAAGVTVKIAAYNRQSQSPQLIRFIQQSLIDIEYILVAVANQVSLL